MVLVQPSSSSSNIHIIFLSNNIHLFLRAELKLTRYHPKVFLRKKFSSATLALTSTTTPQKNMSETKKVKSLQDFTSMYNLFYR